jgi:hypothetical protein
MINEPPWPSAPALKLAAHSQGGNGSPRTSCGRSLRPVDRVRISQPRACGGERATTQGMCALKAIDDERAPPVRWPAGCVPTIASRINPSRARLRPPPTPRLQPRPPRRARDHRRRGWCRACPGRDIPEAALRGGVGIYDASRSAYGGPWCVLCLEGSRQQIGSR